MGNVAQYKPGQFVKVNAPGRYRMVLAKRVVDACDKCDLSAYCYTRRDLFKSRSCVFENRSCVETVGWCGYLVRIK